MFRFHKSSAFLSLAVVVAVAMTLCCSPKEKLSAGKSGTPTPAREAPAEEGEAPEVADNHKAAPPLSEATPPERSEPIMVEPLAQRPEMAKSESQKPGKSGLPDADASIPSQGELPRDPLDYLIGELGPVDAPPGAYSAAWGYLKDLLASSDGAKEQPALSSLKAPVSVRLGAGRPEQNDGASFLVRLISKDLSVPGEIQLIRVDGAWSVDSLVLDEPVTVGGKGAFDPLIYKRFL